VDHDLSPASDAVRRHLTARFPERELTALAPPSQRIYQRFRVPRHQAWAIFFRR
jgi:hypothetical protein